MGIDRRKGTVELEEHIEAPAERVADYVSDFRNAREWMVGVESVEYLGEDTFQLNLQTPVGQLSPVAEVVERENGGLRWIYTTLISGGGSIAVSPEGEGCRVAYSGEFAPQSRIANRIARVLGMDRFARRNGERSLIRLKALMEARRY